MSNRIKCAAIAAIGILLPYFSPAQDIGNDINSLHSVLDQLYEEMMPLVSLTVLDRALPDLRLRGISLTGYGAILPRQNP